MRDPSIQGVSPHLYMTICPIQFETWLFRPHNIFSVIKIQSNDGVREPRQGAELSAAYSIMVHQMIYDCESPCQLRYFVQFIRWHLCTGLKAAISQQISSNFWKFWTSILCSDSFLSSMMLFCQGLFPIVPLVRDLKFYRKPDICDTLLTWSCAKIQISSLLWKCCVPSLVHRRFVPLENYLNFDNLLF